MIMPRLNSKRGRKSDYVKSLNTDQWRETRRMVLIRDKFMCRDCGSKLYLEVHHLTYIYKGDEHNHLGCLITLCSDCHKKRHNK